MNFNVDSLQGWCTQEKAQMLYDLVLSCNSQISIELGVFGGRSLIPIALAHKEKGSGFVLGIDAWNKEAATTGSNSAENNEWWEKVNYHQIYQSCIEAIENNLVSDFCGTVKMKSETLGILVRDNSIDLLHQDSSHNIETIIKELEIWIPKLKHGAYWIADDTDWTQAKDGYSKLPDYGLTLINDFNTWQIWRKA